MVIFSRIFIILFVCLLALGGLWLSGGQVKNHFAEPFILLLVLGTTLFLGLLTYSWDDLRGVFLNLLTQRGKIKNPRQRRIIAQMALYGLITGILLAAIPVLYRLGSAGGLAATRYETLRVPLVTLFYGVLTALGFWVASGADDLSKNESSPAGQPFSERNQLVFAFCVLLLTVGLLSLFIIGMNLDLPGSQSHLDPEMMDVVFGLKQGEDMVWRPVNQSEPDTGEIPDSKNSSGSGAALADSAPAFTLVAQEPPLRWEPVLTQNVQNPPCGTASSPTGQTPR